MTPRLIAPLRLAAALVAAAPAPSAAASAPKHLILIMMENHGTDTLLGNKEDAPFLTELVTQPGVRFATQYYGVTHPSLPNYLALIAGDEMGTTTARPARTSSASRRNLSPTRTNPRRPAIS